jgi:SAM-dependent methyltransferase
MQPLPPVNPVGTWEDYFASTRGLPPHPIYREMEPYLPASGTALELGCGVGTGARWLAARGLRVRAVDALPEAIAEARAFPVPEGLSYECGYMQALNLPEAAYDLVVAGFCLFFLTRPELTEFWPRLVASIRPGGLFAGQFLGERDDWARDYTAQTRGELDAMLAPFEALHLEEAERDGKTSLGTPKHWHVFHVVARRTAP